MDECCGWWGKKFGHDFQPKIIRYDSTNAKCSGKGDIADILDALASKEYIVVCTRCGKRPEINKVKI